MKQLAEKLQKTGKAMTDRIDSVLCNKEDEISIELSSEKLESSMNLYAANAQFFGRECSQPKSGSFRNNKHHSLRQNYQL